MPPDFFAPIEITAAGLYRQGLDRLRLLQTEEDNLLGHLDDLWHQMTPEERSRFAPPATLGELRTYVQRFRDRPTENEVLAELEQLRAALAGWRRWFGPLDVWPGNGSRPRFWHDTERLLGPEGG